MIRGNITRTVTATNSAATSEKIDHRNTAFGGLIVPTGVTTIDWYAALTADATPAVVCDQTGAAVQSSGLTAGQWLPIPDECMGLPYLVCVVDEASTTLVAFLKD